MTGELHHQISGEPVGALPDGRQFESSMAFGPIALRRQRSLMELCLSLKGRQAMTALQDEPRRSTLGPSNDIHLPEGELFIGEFNDLG